MATMDLWFVWQPCDCTLVALAIMNSELLWQPLRYLVTIGCHFKNLVRPVCNFITFNYALSHIITNFEGFS